MSFTRFLFSLFLLPSALGARPVVLISVDGMKPSYVLEAEKLGLRVPNLRKMLKEGAYATAVTGVLPTLTYPSHSTIVTGVSPAVHGIFSNKPFDPLGTNLDGWFFYAESLRAPALWDVMAKEKLKSATVDWPVTVGAAIDYRIPQYFRGNKPTPDDHKLLKALATPGLLEELEKDLPPYPAGYNYTIDDDRLRGQYTSKMLALKKPDLHLGYLSSLDEEQHAVGPDHPKVYQVLEKIDAILGDIQKSVDEAYDGEAVFAVVSDHGFIRVDRDIRINTVLKGTGAFAWAGDGLAAVFLKDPKDKKAYARVNKLLTDFARKESNGILKVITDVGPLRNTEGLPEVSFLLAAKPGFALVSDQKKPTIAKRKSNGEHGYLAELPEMDAAFLIVGKDIPKGRSLGRIDMRDIAPTLAKILGVSLPGAEGQNRLPVDGQ